MALTSGNEQHKIRVSNALVRDLAIIKQSLDKKPRVNDKRAILETIKRIKLVQLDTINVVERSHYLVVLSRIGLYDKQLLDELLFFTSISTSSDCRCLHLFGDHNVCLFRK